MTTQPRASESYEADAGSHPEQDDASSENERDAGVQHAASVSPDALNEADADVADTLMGPETEEDVAAKERADANVENARAALRKKAEETAEQLKKVDGITVDKELSDPETPIIGFQEYVMKVDYKATSIDVTIYADGNCNFHFKTKDKKEYGIIGNLDHCVAEMKKNVDK